MSMAHYYLDANGRWLGQCLYCMRYGRAENLRRTPHDKIDREYCPRCFYDVLEHDMKAAKRYEEMVRNEWRKL